jgi:hypothetical protein
LGDYYFHLKNAVIPFFNKGSGVFAFGKDFLPCGLGAMGQFAWAEKMYLFPSETSKIPFQSSTITKDRSFYYIIWWHFPSKIS